MSENSENEKNVDNMDRYINLWKKVNENGEWMFMNMIIGSLISSDTIVTKQNCLKSQKYLTNMKNALEAVSDIREDKKEY